MFKKFQEYVVAGDYDLAKEILLEMMDAKKFNREEELDPDFMNWLLNFLDYLQIQKDKFYQD